MTEVSAKLHPAVSRFADRIDRLVAEDPEGRWDTVTASKMLLVLRGRVEELEGIQKQLQDTPDSPELQAGLMRKADMAGTVLMMLSDNAALGRKDVISA